MNKKILFIAYHFPPDALVGSVRPAKFVKYLRELGWEPCVLTIKDQHISMKEYNRLSDVTDVSIVRTAVWPTLLELILKCRNTLKSQGRRIKISKTGPTSEQKISGGQNSGHAGFFIKAGRKAKKRLDEFFELPDKQIGWLVPAIWSAYRICKREKIRVVVTTSPPRTTALVGVVLSLFLNVKLITDLRDPWHNGSEYIHDSRDLSERIRAWLEKQIMVRSERVITTSENYQKLLQNIYITIPENRFVNIWNGYDEQDFAGLHSAGHNEKFTLSYIGTFYLGRTPRPFLDALSDLVRLGIIPKESMEVNLIGAVQKTEGVPTEQLVNNAGLHDCVTIRGSMSHRAALEQMLKSDVLLLFVSKQYYAVPAKTFEYLRSGRRILCFTDEGATADLIRRSQAGMIVAPYNVSQIRDAIHQLYREWQSKRTPERRDSVRMFERRLQAEQLSELIAGII